MISLSVTLTVRPELVERFLEAFALVTRGALEDEEGCLHYELSRSADEDNVFHIYEVYRDEAALDAHRRSAHFTAWRTVSDEVLMPDGRTTRLGVIVGGSSLSELEKEK